MFDRLEAVVDVVHVAEGSVLQEPIPRRDPGSRGAIAASRSNRAAAARRVVRHRLGHPLADTRPDLVPRHLENGEAGLTIDDAVARHAKAVDEERRPTRDAL